MFRFFAEVAKGAHLGTGDALCIGGCLPKIALITPAVSVSLYCYQTELDLSGDTGVWDNLPLKMWSAGHTLNLRTLVCPFVNHPAGFKVPIFLLGFSLWFIPNHVCFTERTPGQLASPFASIFLSFYILLVTLGTKIFKQKSPQLFLASLCCSGGSYRNCVLFVTNKSWAPWLYEFVGL